MTKVGFKRRLLAGCEEEYQKRHDAIWPDLVKLLGDRGISDYSLFLDAETHILFGVLQINDKANLDSLPAEPIMQKWWAYMADIMETNADSSPVSIPLKEVFFMK